MYSQETDAERNSVSAYYLVNAALRSEDRNKAVAVKKLKMLLLEGLSKCPKPECKILRRGVCEDLCAPLNEPEVLPPNTRLQVQSLGGAVLVPLLIPLADSRR